EGGMVGRRACLGGWRRFIGLWLRGRYWGRRGRRRGSGERRRRMWRRRWWRGWRGGKRKWEDR
ncbi:hypothetical protein LTS18_004121, partial [Coniosporium uncinatum]